jgi:hypothetical protein
LPVSSQSTVVVMLQAFDTLAALLCHAASLVPPLSVSAVSFDDLDHALTADSSFMFPRLCTVL